MWPFTDRPKRGERETITLSIDELYTIIETTIKHSEARMAKRAAAIAFAEVLTVLEKEGILPRVHNSEQTR